MLGKNLPEAYYIFNDKAQKLEVNIAELESLITHLKANKDNKPAANREERIKKIFAVLMTNSKDPDGIIETSLSNFLNKTKPHV